MKLLVTIFLVIASALTYAQKNESMEQDLQVLKRIGGAGNGGNTIALKIAKLINKTALEIGIDNIDEFRKSYKIIVGDYNKGPDATKNSVIAYYSKEDRAILIDLKSWNKLSNEEVREKVTELVNEIRNNK